ncbi:MAG: hypothetical protein PX483_12975 [Nostocales cyanobacterium LE14-WE4]|nr:hypothetical protein [Anabaena sp. 49633_E8]MCE2701645.1 hypothetical protein [Anabaena sp. 49633_E8]MDJ0501744.1 hypothetical protein [Nostocales cyanobacterium LE14-WE4]
MSKFVLESNAQAVTLSEQDLRNSVQTINVNASEIAKQVTIIQNFGYNPTACEPGRQVVSIMFGNKEYCVEPRPPLTGLKYRYNSTTNQLELFDAPKSNNRQGGDFKFY